MNENAQRSVLCLFPKNEIEGLEDFRQRYILHSGKSVPFHVTLLSNFYLPQEINEDVINKLRQIAQSTPKFEFKAKPLSSFPTTKVLYLTPSPLTPIEELSEKLYRAFPDFHNTQYGFPVFHMTIALGNPAEEMDKIVDEYFERFDKSPLGCKAGHLGIYVQYGDQWREYLSINIG
jgi:2'-5' RNA ligase